MKRTRYLLGFFFGIFRWISLRLKKSVDRHLSSNEIICIYFHNPPVRKFEKIVEYLRQRKVHFVSQDDVIDYLYHGKVIRGGVWITFDDGWKSNKLLVPVINKYKIPITIFLTTYAIENNELFWASVYPLKYGKRVGEEFHKLAYQDKMQCIRDLETQYRLLQSNEVITEEEVKDMASNPLISFGGHTHNHVSVNNFSDSELSGELMPNNTIIEKWSGKGVKSFSFPYGVYNGKEFTVLKDSGIVIGVTIERGTINKESNPFYLPRVGISEGSMIENYCRIFNCWK